MWLAGSPADSLENLLLTKATDAADDARNDLAAFTPVAGVLSMLSIGAGAQQQSSKRSWRHEDDSGVRNSDCRGERDDECSVPENAGTAVSRPVFPRVARDQATIRARDLLTPRKLFTRPSISRSRSPRSAGGLYGVEPS